MPLQKVPSAQLAPFLETHSGPVPVMFSATWCGFCARFGPQFRARAEKTSAPFAVVDISDESDPLWDTFDIEVVPTVIVFENGKPKARVGGVLGDAHLVKVLTEGKVS